MSDHEAQFGNEDAYETERTCTNARPRRRNGCDREQPITQFGACHTTPVALVSPGAQNTVGTVDPDPAKITKKCLQKRPQSGTFAELRLSEASEEYGTYQYFRSRTARRVSGVPRTEGGKVLPEKVSLLFEEKAKPCVSDLS